MVLGNVPRYPGNRVYQLLEALKPTELCNFNLYSYLNPIYINIFATCQIKTLAKLIITENLKTSVPDT